MKQNGALRSRYTKKVDIPGTIRKAVEHGKTELPLCIAAEDLCEKELTKKRVYRLLFVVDVSRSVGAKERLAFAKGAVMSLLGQAYRKRDKVGMVVFGDGQAQLILPFTKSVDLAAERLRELKAKGNSPVGMGIREALKVVRAEKRKHPQDPCLLILLTDGKCNYDVQEGKPMEQAKKAARQISREQIPALVIDCDRSVFGMGLAKELAKEAQALCVDLN